MRGVRRLRQLRRFFGVSLRRYARHSQAQSGEADNSINLPQQIAGNIFEKLRAVTFTSKVKTRVRLRCEAEAVWLLNVLVISQR